MSKRTVLMVTDGLGQGGAERQLFLTATNLSDKWNVTVWTLHDGYFRKLLEQQGIMVVTSSEHRGWISAVVSLRKTCTTIQPDIIHVWGSAALFPVELMYKGRIPILNGTIRRSFLPIGWFNRLRARISSRLGDLTVSNSRAGIDAFDLESVSHAIIRNGFIQDRVKSTSPVEMDSEKTNVVMCANVKPEKDYALLVRTANLALRKYGKQIPFKFWCIGNIVDSDYFSELRADGEELLKTEAMVFTGSTETPADYYTSSDIGILLSNPNYHAEGISNSIMEYMASSLPVICSDSGGNRELVLDGVTGFILGTGSETEVLSRLEALREDSSLANTMGRMGKERIVEEFSLERMIEETQDTYIRLIGKSNN